MRRYCILALTLTSALCAQTARTIQATGSATLMVTPDQAGLDIGVFTSAATAQDAAQQNATQSTTVISAVKAVIGTTGSVQTLYYVISPRYAPNSSNINGYTANNTIHVTMNDLTVIGRVIDAANAAGANTAGNLSFGLQDHEPSVQQALTTATKQAMAHANAIAAGLGGKIGAVVSAQEGASYSPIVTAGAGSGAVATSTPVQTGTVNVYGTVTLVVQLQ